MTSLNQILNLESKRSRGGIQSHNSMKLLIESVPALSTPSLNDIATCHGVQILYQTTDGSLEMFQSRW